ncbi:MAG: 4-(cytidine 5'-diphospho)-2-C-methyl-D-erythritol kinase [Aquificae bacterium]|nr:4-(cytidine 5'-diphospho)-2-C-methyl-D-erythritol kinase [Aquificota bacterium]
MIKILSPAKINLGLWVLGKREDGYHELITIFKQIPLCDEITLTEGKTEVLTDPPIPQEKNIVYKGLLEFEKLTGIKPKVRVFIKKNIPPGSGLGGGSSNLASTLSVVNELHNTPLTKKELKSLLSRLSSDAPFFLEGGVALASGKGDILKPVKDSLPRDITLVIPPVSCSTPLVYANVKPRHYTPKEEALAKAERVLSGDTDAIENVLGEIASELFPPLGDVLAKLRKLGMKPYVSGSGSCVYTFSPVSPELLELAKRENWKVFRLKT